MFDGAPLDSWSHTQAGMLGWAALVLGGLWLQHAAFPRESQRMVWAWTRPRQLTTRNSSESPRTLGVLISHGMSMVGLGLLFGWTELTPLGGSVVFSALGGSVILAVLKGGVAHGAFPNLDDRGCAIEIHRHHMSLTALGLALWTAIAAIHPWCQQPRVACAGAAMIWSILALHGAWRATQALKNTSRQPLRGILYLCTLEWGVAVTSCVWLLQSCFD
ncbi:MAG: hypothetical protein O3B70_04385 [Bacteroidetes bacterium]|nr:hypothetical protein [Bacteroidota bacterium]MDA1242140.1 hypothetical protein [Bacteroidota bacterium]